MAILRRHTLAIGLVAIFLLCFPIQADAYIGPGAGFVFLSSFLLMVSGLVVAALSILAWPFRAVWLVMRRPRAASLARRMIIVGFDGQDPALTDELMQKGLLPNFSRIAATGCYAKLRTTYPSISPVAWSSFSTGTQPGKHGIFDFLDRDRRTYLPLLSSVKIGAVERVLRIGRFQVPVRRPSLTLLRRSRPFWSILGEYGVWSTVLRVPVTFPPDRFHGAELSAMCTPDLLGTQGTFLLFTTRAGSPLEEGGLRISIRIEEGCGRAVITGPPNPFRAGTPPLELPFEIHLDRASNSARVVLNGRSVVLERGRLSGWLRLKFHAAPGVSIHGLSRWLITEMEEHFSLYISPISLDPERPAMPVSHPAYYANYLAKRIGPFSTLGLAEDTWALNERVIDNETFLQQTYDIDAERQAMFSVALDTLQEGVLACVFDATDRIQHMFWRQFESRGDDAGKPSSPHADTIPQLYRSNDRFLGSLLDRIGSDDLLMVISDHGFSAFRRGINLNAWLLSEGYLKLKPGADGSAEWLRDVDWAATRAYAMGLAGLFLNLKTREAHGNVAPGAEADGLKSEIGEKLRGLRDPQTGTVAIVETFEATKVYQGPYVAGAPDLLVGYNRGYRVSWGAAKGVVVGPIFADNDKAWSGDHCIDPRLVPGVLFCNRKLSTSDPALMDIAPTALHVFGVPRPNHMDGRSLLSA